MAALLGTVHNSRGFAGVGAKSTVFLRRVRALRRLQPHGLVARLLDVGIDVGLGARRARRNYARARDAQENGRVLRYVASVTRRRVEVGLQAVESTSPFAALTGTDNQVAFTTMRYQTNPLIITGPGAGPAVTAAGVLNDILALAAS